MIKNILAVMIMLTSVQGLANLTILPDTTHNIAGGILIFYASDNNIGTFEQVHLEVKQLDKNYDGYISSIEGNGVRISEILPTIETKDKLTVDKSKNSIKFLKREEAYREEGKREYLEEEERKMRELNEWLTEVPGQNRAWSNSNSATTSITECKKAKRAYNFYHKKMKRGAFTGILSSALTGHSTFDSNKHDIYEIQRDNAEGFLEVNNCSAYGIYK